MKRGRHPAVDRTRQAEFARDWKAGIRVVDLAVKYGCSGGVVSATARRLGLPARYGKRVLRRGRWVPNAHGVQVWDAA